MLSGTHIVSFSISRYKNLDMDVSSCFNHMKVALLTRHFDHIVILIISSF